MNTSSQKLRQLVIDNSLTLGRLSKETLGVEDYNSLTSLYQNALDALTLWASMDYIHQTQKDTMDNAYDKCKAILALYETDDDRIAIDPMSLRTLRDLAIKPQRQYSKEYKDAEKARKKQEETAQSRYTDILTLGAVARLEDEDLPAYLVRVKAQNINFVVNGIDMLEMYQNAMATLVVKTKAVEDIKAKGNWTWRRPVAVNTATFGELFENYIADCLVEGYNIRPSQQVREALKAEREARKAEKQA